MVEGGGGGGGGTAECCSPMMMGYGFSFSIKSQGAIGDPNTSYDRTGGRMSKGKVAEGSTSLVSLPQGKSNQRRSRRLGSKDGNDDESRHYKHDFVGSVLHKVGVALCGGSSRDFCCTCRHTQALLQRCQQLSHTSNETRDAVDNTTALDDRLEGIISAIGCASIGAQMQWLTHVTCCNTPSTVDESGGNQHTSRHIAITLPDPVDLSTSDRLAYMGRYYDAMSTCLSTASPPALVRPEGADLLDCLLQSYHNSSVFMDPLTHRLVSGTDDADDTSTTLLSSPQQCLLSSCHQCHLPSSPPSASLLCGMFNQAYLALYEVAYCSPQMYDIDILREINRFLGDYCSPGGGHIGQNYEGPSPLLASSSSSKAVNNDDYDQHGSELNIFLLMCYMICFSGGLQLLTRQFSTYRPVDSLPVTLTPTRIRTHTRTYTRTRTPPIERTREESYYQLSS